MLPEATGALRYVLSGSKEGAERLEKLRRQFEPDEFNVLSGYMLGRMGMPTGSAAGASELGEQAAKSGAEAMAEAGFSPNRFVTNWNNLSKEAKEALFGGTEYADLAPALDDLVFTIDRVGKTAAQMANPSGLDFFTPFPNPQEEQDIQKLIAAQRFVDDELQGMNTACLVKADHRFL